MVDMQTQDNRPDQYNPWGTVKWSEDANGDWTQRTTLTADSQRALDAEIAMGADKAELAQGMMGRLEDEYGTAMDWGGLGDAQELEFDPTEIRQQAEDAAYARSSGRLDDRFATSDNELEISLRNRGLQEGDAAFDSAMANQNSQRTDAYSAAQNDAVAQGRAESDQMYQQQEQQANYANNLRQQQMQEEMTKRGFTLNEINAIMSGQQVQAPSFEGFNQSNKAAGVDYSGAAAAQGAADQAAYQSMVSGVTDLAGAGAGMMCDRRLKQNIVKIGEFMGFPFYVFDYIWGERAAGVMADEVNAEAVYTLPSGFKFVDYSKLKAGGS